MCPINMFYYDQSICIINKKKQAFYVLNKELRAKTLSKISEIKNRKKLPEVTKNDK